MRDLDRQVAELDSIARELYSSRSDLQAAFSSCDAAPFWIWLQTHGFREDPRVRALSIPLPPSVLWRFANPGDEWAFLLTGAATYRLLSQVAEDRGSPLDELGPVLDFGCGPGRGLRFLLREATKLRCVATDVDRAAIDWCRENFNFGEFLLNSESAPLDLDDATFGLVCSISVFSHFSDWNQIEWLRELARVAKDAAIVVLTVHGRHALECAVRESTRREMLGVTPAELAEVDAELGARGFAFVRQREGHLCRDRYGIAFVTEEYVRARWQDEFDVVSYQPASIDGWQDAIVLRRKARSGSSHRSPTVDGF